MKIFWGLLLVSGLALFSINFLNQQLPIDPGSINESLDLSSSMGEFHGTSVALPNTLAEARKLVLGENSLPKRIEVDLASQRLYAFEGDDLVYNFLISSGKWGRTPTGTFRIWGKFRYTKMEGGNKALHTYYYLPNVPYVMFFANDKVAASRGFSLHGTYWHNNFGIPMSHGCVNMKTEEAAIIYEWSGPSLKDKKSIRATDDNPGTEIVIYGTPPKG